MKFRSYVLVHFSENMIYKLHNIFREHMFQKVRKLNAVIL